MHRRSGGCHDSPRDGGAPATSRRRRPRRGSLERPVERPPLPRRVPARSRSRSCSLAFSDRAAGAAAARRYCRRTSTGRRDARSRPTSPATTPTGRRAAPVALAPRSGSATRCGRTACRSRRTRGRRRSPAAARCACRTSGPSRADSRAEAIVVMAHRDDTGDGPGANDNATGTAALIELARGYAHLDDAAARACGSAHTIVFLSTDAGSFGGLGALRFADAPAVPRRRGRSTSTRSAGAAPPRLEIAGDAPRSPAASLVADGRAPGRWSRRARPPATPSFVGQLIDLGFPFTLYEQGPFVARGHPGADAHDGGRASARVFTDRRAARLDPRARPDRPRGAAARRLARPGARAGAGDDEVRLGGHAVRPRLGDRARAVHAARPVPRRASSISSRTAGGAASRSCPRCAASAAGSRCGCSPGCAFYVFRLLGAWPAGAAASAEPGVARRRRLARARAARCSSRSRRRLAARPAAPRPAPARRAEEQLAGETAALLGLGVVSLLVWQRTRMRSCSSCRRCTCGCGCRRCGPRRAPARALLLVAGLTGPALIVLSLAIRFGLGFDAPWYLLELVSLGYVQRARCRDHARQARRAPPNSPPSTARRYAPYPDRDERPPFGPFRSLVRTLVLTGARDGRRRSAALPAASSACC